MLTQAESLAVLDQIFSKVRGQKVAIQRLKNLILAARVDGFMAPQLIVAAPGLGKSKLLKAFKDACRKVLGRSTVGFDDGAECGTKVAFVEEVLIPHFNYTDPDSKDKVLAIDECHNMKGPVASIVRSFLQPDAARSCVTIRPHGDYEMTFNPNKMTVILATNKIDKLDPALVSRFERLDLVDYLDNEMEEILSDALEGADIQFNENTMRKIAECNRGTARDIVHWVNAIRQHLTIANKKTINKADVREIIRMRETYPLGVSQNELKTLLALETFGHMQLKELAAKNLIEAKEQNANEKYLLQRRLIGIDGKRHLTPEGMAYLADLRKEGYIAKKVSQNESED